MLSKKLEEALNAQVNAEFWSAYLYLSMSTHFASQGLSGFAHWFKSQFEEEQEHAMRFMDYIVSRGGKVELKPIAAVDTKWNSPLHAFEETLKHEKIVSGLIYNLVAMAQEEKDYATDLMLQWFVNEQVEEEDTAQGYVDALKLIEGNNVGVYMLNKELGERK
ncbi:ferritin [Dysgonomonas sp. 216]|uniref:ferritin n=1 Tax=Dysgonomonas sp. 216 TaxID=2302934 RepID=UPI0013D3C53F|nr:ferritin [Dysgonomonas sp. 216]NDW18559.1 ferritin [Dysgonomonas sp. 216]